MAWLDHLACASTGAGEDYPTDVTQRLMYVLLPIRDEGRLDQLGVQPVSARLRKDGTFASSRYPYSANTSTPNGPSDFRPSDIRIVCGSSRQPIIHALTIRR